jgi:hypothetical protein
MKVYRTWLSGDRVDEEGLTYYTTTGEVVEIGGQRLVETYGGALSRDVDKWHTTQQAAMAEHVPAMYRAAARILDQAKRVGDAARAIAGDPAGGGRSAAGIAPPEVAT